MTVNDIAAVHDINAANIPEVGDVDIDRMRELFNKSNIALVVEADEGGLVGFCIVFGPDADYDSVNYQWFVRHYPGIDYLDRVAFTAPSRGRGFGTALYAEVQRRLGPGAPLGLEVNIEPPNEPSLAFHRKLGFVEVGRQPFDDHEVTMMLRTS